MEIIQSLPQRVVRIAEEDRDKYAVGDGPFRVIHECATCDGINVILDHKGVTTLQYVVNRCRVCERRYQLDAPREDCPGCREKYGPSHMGSSSCRSGSLASGGSRSHCTCDTCF